MYKKISAAATPTFEFWFDIDTAKYTHHQSVSQCCIMWQHAECFKKSSPLKLFRIFSLLFTWNCKFVGNSYPHISYNFCRFILTVSSNDVNFSTSTHRFHSVKFWVFTQKMNMHCTSFSEITSLFRHRVSQWSITINNRQLSDCLLLSFYWHCFKAW